MPETLTDKTYKELYKNLLNRNRRAISRALSIIENEESNYDKLIDLVFASGGTSKIIGITGPPGAGKSTLINALISSFLEDNLSVAILAVDPSSPFSGGALLGDRARMIHAGLNDQIFIRSCASRGQLGGLSPRTPELLYVLEAARFDIIIIETVGVGQAELDIMKCADIVTVVLSPHMGDSLQALKAGIIEIADIFALNKSDLPGIHDLEKDLLLSLSLAPKDIKQPPLFKVTSTEQTGVEELKNGILSMYEQHLNNNLISRKKRDSLSFQFELFLKEFLFTILKENTESQKKKDSIQKSIFNRSKSPRKGAKELIKWFLKNHK